MADIEIGMNRATLLKLADNIKATFEGQSNETSLSIPFVGGEVTIGNEDMEREDVEDGEVYVDISDR